MVETKNIHFFVSLRNNPGSKVFLALTSVQVESDPLDKALETFVLFLLMSPPSGGAS